GFSPWSSVTRGLLVVGTGRPVAATRVCLERSQIENRDPPVSAAELAGSRKPPVANPLIQRGSDEGGNLVDRIQGGATRIPLAEAASEAPIWHRAFSLAVALGPAQTDS